MDWLRSLLDAPDLRSGEGKVKATVCPETCAQPVPPPTLLGCVLSEPRSSAAQQNFLT